MTAITPEASGRLASASWLLPSILECNAALVEFAFADVGIALDCARKLSTAKSASEFDEVLMRHARQQFQAASEAVAQLSALVEYDPSGRDEQVNLTFWD